MLQISPEVRIGVHHGSLAAETREQMENDLKDGKLDAMICTSSLELGIDVGSIKAVHQIQSPRSVDSLLQRIGRSEHKLGGTGRGEILVWEHDDIAESAVIARKALAKELPDIEWRLNPTIVAANQLLQMAMERRLYLSKLPMAYLHLHLCSKTGHSKIPWQLLGCLMIVGYLG